MEKILNAEGKENTSKARIKEFNSREKEKRIFYICCIVFPVLQFLIFYVYVNFQSILLAFQNYQISGGRIKVSFVGFRNFASAWNFFVENIAWLKNSLLNFSFTSALGLVLALIFSFYIYKKFPAAGFFKVVLFIPKIIPGIVFAMLFKFIISYAYPEAVEILTGKVVQDLFNNSDTEFGTIIFFNVWISFGVNVMLLSGSMNNINNSVVESAQLDGVNIFQEFWHITIPMIFPTLTTFIIVAITGIFTHQMGLFSLYGGNGKHVGTWGYYMYLASKNSDVYTTRDYLPFTELAALGLIFTAILFPTVLFIRKMLVKYGPSVD